MNIGEIKIMQKDLDNPVVEYFKKGQSEIILDYPEELEKIKIGLEYENNGIIDIGYNPDFPDNRLEENSSETFSINIYRNETIGTGTQELEIDLTDKTTANNKLSLVIKSELADKLVNNSIKITSLTGIYSVKGNLITTPIVIENGNEMGNIPIKAGTTKTIRIKATPELPNSEIDEVTIKPVLDQMFFAILEEDETFSVLNTASETIVKSNEISFEIPTDAEHGSKYILAVKTKAED